MSPSSCATTRPPRATLSSHSTRTRLTGAPAPPRPDRVSAPSKHRLLLFGLVALALAAPLPALAATFYVDNTNPAANEGGPGTEAIPYRTIQTAVTQNGAPGNTIIVKPGTYREQVTVMNSGAPGNPFIIQALGSPVIVHGEDIRAHGFRLAARSYVHVIGFNITHTTDKGIYLLSASNNCVISGNSITFTGSQGITVNGCTDVVLESNVTSDNRDHGISLLNVSASTLRGNESFRNARVTVRAANGISLMGSAGNRVEGNRVHDNEDTGLQISAGSNNNVVLQNRSWRNGDHGIDHLNSTGNHHIGCVAWGNFNEGMSIEGNSTGTRVFNCISVDNGLTTNGVDLLVDPSSFSGFDSNFNIFWNSTPQAPVRVNGVTYATVAAYSAATGEDANSIQADPRFVNPAAGDFHLQPNSPAIDAATSSVANWPALDAEGNSRFDDPATANTGVGPVAFADRGALEFLGGGPPVDRAPIVNAPGSVSVPVNQQLTFVVTASDPDGDPIQSLTFEGQLPSGSNAQFNVGSGNTSGTFTWTPTSSDAGTYSITFRASNALSGTATTSIRVTSTTGGRDRAPVVRAPHKVKAKTGKLLTIKVTAFDPNDDPIQSLTADLSDLPSGATFTTNSSNTEGQLKWTPGRGDKGKYQVTFTASNALTGRAKTRISVKRQSSRRHRDRDRDDDNNDDNDDNDDGDGDGGDGDGGGGGGVTTFEGPSSSSVAGIPDHLTLSEAAPNPSRNEVSFALDLPEHSRIEWGVYDLQGRLLWHERVEHAAGRMTLRWNGLNLKGGRAGAGIYMIRAIVGNERFTRRFVRL